MVQSRTVTAGVRWWVWPLVAILALGAGYSGTRFLFGGTLQRPVNVLVLGIDEARSDVTMVVRFDPNSKTIAALSIPRDSMVAIPGRQGLDKINAAHAYGGPVDGPKLALQTVQNYLGIPIDYFARLDFDTFPQVIDAMGGVEMDISKPMDYDDPYQNLAIHFKPGHYTLTGQQALEYVRYRKDSVDPSRVTGSDIDREERQHQFLKTLLASAKKHGTLVRLPLIIPTAYKAVHTNMPLDVATRLAVAARGLTEQSLVIGTVPGKAEYIDDLWYWKSTPEQVRTAVDKYLLHPAAAQPAA